MFPISVTEKLLEIFFEIYLSPPRYSIYRRIFTPLGLEIYFRGISLERGIDPFFEKLLFYYLFQKFGDSHPKETGSCDAYFAIPAQGQQKCLKLQNPNLSIYINSQKITGME